MRADDAMWALVAFDLPTGSKEMRRAANRYRSRLLALGFRQLQLSVYVRYLINGSTFPRVSADVSTGIPEGGIVRVIPVSDKAWGRSVRLEGEKRTAVEPAPQQLTIF